MPSEIKSPGGLAFELVWQKPSKDPTKVLNSPPSKDDATIERRVKEKQMAAEERRKSMEFCRKETLEKKNIKFNETLAKAGEIDQKFKETAEVKLTEKLGKVQENKKACKESLMLRLKVHEERIEQVQKRKKEIGENGDASPTSS